MNYEENILRAIDYMEEHLQDNLSLEEIAAQAYYSSFHFHRLFFMVTMETPGNYLRKRRLSQAAWDILQTNKRLLEIALDYQFQSQESFSRSFKNFFGVAPGQYRRSHGCSSKNRFARLQLENLKHRYRGGISVEPEFKTMPAMKLMGCICSIEGNTEKIPQLWHSFINKKGQIPNIKNEEVCYGLCFHTEESMQSGLFLYMACFEVDILEDIPIAMVGKTIPKNEYAVFTHKGSVDKIKDTYEYISGALSGAFLGIDSIPKVYQNVIQENLYNSNYLRNIAIALFDSI